MKTALIDADTLIYEAALSAEKPVDWGDDLWTLHASMEEARARFEGLVTEIKEATGAERLILALSDGDDQNRWRNRVMPTYKMGRKKVRRPVVYAPLRKFCHETYETFERPTLEGDDVLGILATNPSLVKGEKVIVSLDKDLKTIPGKHYNYGRKEFFFVSDDEADNNHLFQTLTGDSTDGYAGCPGIGPKSAEKILGRMWRTYEMCECEPGVQHHEKCVMAFGFDIEMAWKAIVKAYAKAGLSEEVALMNARVARICREEDYDYEKKEVILWNP